MSFPVSSSYVAAAGILLESEPSDEGNTMKLLRATHESASSLIISFHPVPNLCLN